MWGLILFFIIISLFEWYVFKGVRLLSQNLDSTVYQQIIYWTYWVVTIALLVAVVMAILNGRGNRDFRSNKFVMYLIGVFIMIFIPKLIFFLFHVIDDVVHLIRGLFSPSIANLPGERMTRWRFITQTGLAVASIPFVSIIYGILKGRYDYTAERISISFPNLPSSFDGYKIVQFSDLHIGSFMQDYESVKKGIDLINSLEPDIIVFTGDFVNNFADETDGWENTLGQLKAKYGKYSILGNHDYGDYSNWPSLEEKQKSLQRLIRFQEKMGLKVLLNEHVKLSLGGEFISLIGIENWSKNFKQYGDLKQAMSGIENNSFKLLLSHDPSHWDAEVLQRTDIDLSLAGHTHGMQFGVNLGGFKYSPVQHVYPRWSGLYSEGNQHLYVNRGFGFVGFPGRVGMSPEITLIELKKA